MNNQAAEGAAIAAGVIFLVALAWSITNLSYNIWGAMLLAPIYGLLGLWIVRSMFKGNLQSVAVALSWGLVLKLFGAFARYWVGFEAYGGGVDAGRYHREAIEKAGEIWNGDRSWLESFPTGTGTPFVENFTASVYTVTGGSQLAGFVTFSFLAFIGVAFFVKAAVTAIPGLAARRYAWLCVLFPSLVYWPSSIGKEALMLLGLGVATYGVALLLTHGGRGKAILLTALGIGFCSLIRPHLAGLWLAAALPAIGYSVIRGNRSSERSSGRFGQFLVLLVSIVVFAGLAQLTRAYLGALTDETGSASFTEILDETQRRTSQAGSNFDPPSIDSPAGWPYAIVRTLTRPLPFEASGLAQLLAAGEIVLLLAVYGRWWRSVVHAPKLAVRVPFVVFAISAVLLGGLAFASLANTGVLTRQKSLLFPLLLLLPCLPKGSGSDSAELPSDVEASPVTESQRTGKNRGARAITPVEVDEFWKEPGR